MVKLGAFVLRYLCFLIKVGQSSQRAVDKLKASMGIDLKRQIRTNANEKGHMQNPVSVGKAAVPQCRPAPYPTQSCNTAKCERGEGRVGVPHCGY